MSGSVEDVDKQIADDWAKIQDKYAIDEDTGERKAETPPAEPVKEPPPEGPTEPTPPARDDAGRFVKPPKEAKVKEAEVAQAPHKAPVVPPTAAGARDTSRPPSSWRPAARAEYSKLSPALKAEIHRRESDYLSGQSELAKKADFGTQMSAAIEPYRMLIDSSGTTPERMVADIMRNVAILRTGTPQQKYSTFAGLAQQFGIDLRAYAQPQGDGQPGTPAQPQTRDPRVDELLAQLQQQNEARTQEERRSAETLASRWMQETDTSGEPRRPYVNDVIPDMAAWIQVLKQNPGLSQTELLEQAYERAIWGNPEIRTLLQQQSTQALESQRRADTQQRADAAKRAASVNVPRRASVPSRGKPASMEETLNETARTLGLIS